MGSEDFSESDVFSFVQAAIGSVCALELLLYLRHERDKNFSAEELVREMRSSELAVAQALDGLIQAGLVVENPQAGLVVENPQAGYSYRLSSAQLDGIVERLGIDYAGKPTAIIRAILIGSNEKLRIFADAFRLSGKRE